MEKTVFISQLMGPVLAVAGVSVMAYRKPMQKAIKELMNNYALRYALGVSEMTLGLAIVLSHNVWIDFAALLISLIGWGMVIEGAVWMLMPHLVSGFDKKIRKDQVVIVSGTFALVIGLYLSFYGYLA